MSSYTNAPMIAVTLDTYMASNYSPPYLQAVTAGNSIGDKVKWTHNPAELTVCMTSSKQDFPGSIDSCIKITSVEDLDVFAGGLLSRPLLMDAKLTSPLMRHEYQVNVFVYVNTSHPVIKSQILVALNQARNFLSEGQPFSIEINFNSVVAAWVDYCDKTKFRLSSYSGTGASIEITNAPLFDDCPGCGSDAGQGQTCLVGCCYCLFCPISCPIYLIYRQMIMASKKFYIQANVKHVVWINNSPVTADFVKLKFTRNFLSHTSVATGVKTFTGV